MFHRIFFLSWLLGAALNVSGQNPSREELLARLDTGLPEQEKFETYMQLGKLSRQTNPREAVNYFQQALKLPLHSGMEKGFTSSYQVLGELYQNLSLYDSSILMHRTALKWARKFSIEKEEGHAFLGIGLGFLRLQQYDSAQYYIESALKLGIQQKDAALRSGAYNNLGNLDVEKSDYRSALEHYIKSADGYEQLRDSSGLIRAWGNIGNIENILGELDKARDYALRALAIAEKLDNKTSQAFCHQLLGRIYRKKKDYPQALAEYEKAIGIYFKLSDRLRVSETNNSIGNILFEQGKFAEALNYYKKANQIAHELNSGALLAYSYSSIGSVLFELKNAAKANQYLDSSIYYARLIENRYLVMDAYQIKSEIAATRGDYKEALRLHKRYSELSDSITAEENQTATRELEAKYQTSKKQAEIELLRKDQLLKDATLRQTRITVGALAVAIGLLVAVGYLAFSRNKMIDQAKRQMEIEKVRNQIARDLHDDMGSTLSSISILSKLAMQEDTQEKISKHFKQIGEHTTKMMESMDEMVWSINPENDTLQKTVARMKEFAAEWLEPIGIEYRFEINNSAEAIPLDVAKRKCLFLIFKEAVNNALKYSKAKMISIACEVDRDQLLLTIQDDGCGFDIPQSNSGNGLRNMNERAREAKGFVTIHSKVGEGTRVQLQIPLT
jgi:signal transduction histidine kinase